MSRISPIMVEVMYIYCKVQLSISSIHYSHNDGLDLIIFQSRIWDQTVDSRLKQMTYSGKGLQHYCFSISRSAKQDLTLGTGCHNLINSNTLLHEYKLFIGSLERFGRAVSETSRTFGKNILFGEVMGKRNNWPPAIQYMAT